MVMGESQLLFEVCHAYDFYYALHYVPSSAISRCFQVVCNEMKCLTDSKMG